jgi:hypothetical protein
MCHDGDERFDEILEERERQKREGERKIIRTFSTGATRDTDKDKLDYEGFSSPLVLKRYAEYMHKHRLQKDGTLRDSDNWQKGIPTKEYMKSIDRHIVDLWLCHRGFPEEAREDIEDALCAIMFNAQGYLFEILKEKKKGHVGKVYNCIVCPLTQRICGQGDFASCKLKDYLPIVEHWTKHPVEKSTEEFY